jgi:hypothetical protein
MRLVAVVTQANNEDMPWNLVNQAIWAKVETDFAIISGEPRHFSIEQHLPGKKTNDLLTSGSPACLPTLRPVWMALQPKRKLASNDFNAPSCQPSDPPPKKRHPGSSWVASILRSNAVEDEERRPFSECGVAESSRSEDPRSEPGTSGALDSIPLSDMNVWRGSQRDGPGIKVQHAWDVEYSARVHPRDGVV